MALTHFNPGDKVFYAYFTASNKTDPKVEERVVKQVQLRHNVVLYDFGTGNDYSYPSWILGVQVHATKEAAINYLVEQITEHLHEQQMKVREL